MNQRVYDYAPDNVRFFQEDVLDNLPKIFDFRQKYMTCSALN